MAGQLRNRGATLVARARRLDALPPVSPIARPSPTPPRTRRGAWDDDIILALRDELVDPFSEEAPAARERRALLWSEVVDPFATPSSRGRGGREVWSEVLDPWAGEVRRRRR